MEQARGAQSRQSKIYQAKDEQSRQSKIYRTCDDCGNQFDSTAADVVATFMKMAPPSLCGACRVARGKLDEAQIQQMHETTLAYHRKEWLKASHLPGLFLAKGFDKFDPTGNENRLEVIRAYARDFPTDKPPWDYPSLLIVSRNNGVGKTHLACAVLSEIIRRFDKLGFERSPYQFWTAGELRSRIDDSKRFGGESNTDAFEDFETMWLLVLDDLGKEKHTGAEAAAAYDTYYHIINDRYNARLPLIITSNLGLEPLDQAGISLEDIIGKAGTSRLREMCHGQQVMIQGEDRR